MSHCAHQIDKQINIKILLQPSANQKFCFLLVSDGQSLGQLFLSLKRHAPSAEIHVP